jgi:uncharacterized protein YaaN involved in tellurite resistance
MESTQKREDGGLSELIQARQEALNTLLRIRLENHSNRALADAIRRAQRAADALLKASLEYQNETLRQSRRAS